MLKSIRIRNFKSISDAELNLAELTLLIGANSSGKSNVLEALKLLAWIAGNGRLVSIHSAMKEHELRIRGTIRSLTRVQDDRNVLSLGCTLDGPPEVGRLRLDVGLRRTEDGLKIVEEELTAPDLGSNLPLYHVVAPAAEYGNQLTVEYNNFARGRNKPQIVCTDQQAVFVQLVSPARFGANHSKSQSLVPTATTAVQKWLTAILFLDPNPVAMRSYSDRTDRRMQGDGANVSGVLHDLCETRGQKGEVLDFIRALPEQDIQDIRFSVTPRDEVMVELVETFGSATNPCDAALLSDGTLRVLAVAGALLSVDEGSLVVIEEIDNGVHPSRASMLLDRIRTVATRRQLRVLLTTHNPALLDALPASALPDVTICFRRPEIGDSSLVRLRDLKRYPSLVAEGPLGGLATRGVLDRYVKPAGAGGSIDALAWLAPRNRKPHRPEWKRQSTPRSSEPFP